MPLGRLPINNLSVSGTGAVLRGRIDRIWIISHLPTKHLQRLVQSLMLSNSQAPRQKRSKKSLRAMVAHVSFSPIMSFLNGGPTRVSVDFEVFGNVSGVFFTKYCKEMGEKLAIRGWVRNSRKGTVVGKIQGEKEKVDDMAMWLRLQGSPGSRIDRCIFSNWGILDTYDFQNFRVIY